LKVLITGVTGFIGQRLVNAVNGHVRVISRKKQKNYDTVICDFSSKIIPKDVMNGIDVVFHLAGFAHDMRDTKKINDLYRSVNVNSTAELARLAVESSVKRFVFVSSTKAGGSTSTPSDYCTNEEDRRNFDGIYGETK
jgi:UDP-glucose 4-epimerase